jgi:hypothetical protein
MSDTDDLSDLAIVDALSAESIVESVVRHGAPAVWQADNRR